MGGGKRTKGSWREERQGRRDRAGGTLHHRVAMPLFQSQTGRIPTHRNPQQCLDIFTAFLENEPFLWGSRTAARKRKELQGQGSLQGWPQCTVPLSSLGAKRNTTVAGACGTMQGCVHTARPWADTAALWSLLLDAKHLVL